MISIIITSYKEPKTIGKAIESFLNQNIKEDYELIVSAPDEETQKVISTYSEKNWKVKLFKDFGKGKTAALNEVLKIVRGDIIILSDGDVYVGKDSVNEILKFFVDKEVGCVTGQPMSQNERGNMFGYWSHMLCYAAHKMRLRRNNKGAFLECSGYFWSFRNGVITEIPRETAEDTIVPIMFYQKGYKIKYAENAKVYIKYPINMKEFLDQKGRTAKAHETMGKYVDMSNIPRMKSMKNEILSSYTLFMFVRGPRELFWTFWLFPFRLYIWLNSFYKLHIKKDSKVDGWSAVESTK